MGVLIETVRLRAFAKVNYALEVRGLRPDGYHEIVTVMQSVSLADEGEIRRSDEGFSLSVEPEEIVAPEENTVFRAWSLLREITGRDLPARVHLRKKIPAGAGLGGASADAAAALHGLNELYGLGLSVEELRRAGGRIGADVPFCILGGTALGEGVGEILTPLSAPPAHYLLVVKPLAGASTAGVYRRYDEGLWESVPCVGPVVAALERRDLAALAESVGNDLAPVTRKLVPEVEELERELRKLGVLGAVMSGSGTAVYGVFGTEADARRAKRHLRAPFVAVCRPVDRGVEPLP